MELWLISFLCTIVVTTIYLATRSKRGPPGTRELPGPAGLPWVGRFHDVPRFHSWFHFYAWGKKYGPMYQMKSFGKIHIFVSSEKIANELLTKRGAIYSDRPAVPSVVDSKSSTGTGEYLPFMGKNDHWRKQRKYNHGILTASLGEKFYGYPGLEAKRFLMELQKNPSQYSVLLETYCARVMSRLTWGSAEPNDELQSDAWKLLNQMSPAGPITNVITPLLLLPTALSPWMSKEKKRHDKQVKWFLRLQEDVRRKIQNKDYKDPSWTRTFLEQQHQLGWSDYEGAFAIGMLAVAGVFTIGSPLHTFILAMVHHPEWQAKIQEEMEATLPNGRLLEVEDMPKLPLLRAVIKECLRWRPAVPTGVGHEVEEDDVYDGYFIPKGATVHPLEWAFSRDEETYPDAQSFRPERWLEPEWPTFKAPLTQFPTIKEHSLFGFGRRTCLGQSLTYDILFLACGGICWGFNLKKKRDPMTGQEIQVPWNQYNSLLIIKPDPFEFDLQIRGEKQKLELEQAYEEAKKADPLQEL